MKGREKSFSTLEKPTARFSTLPFPHAMARNTKRCPVRFAKKQQHVQSADLVQQI